MKNILANYFSILLSKSHYFVTLSRLIIKYSDNDCNEDMSKNGEKKILEYLIIHNLSDVIFDIGANHGDYIAMIPELKNQLIYAFEPGLRNLEILQKNTSNRHDINIIPYALSSAERVVDFYEHTDLELAGSDSIHDMHNIGYESKTIIYSVKARTLDNICNEKGIKHINFIKCDVEGNELAVFKGSARMLEAGQIDFIQFEFGHAARAAHVFLYDIVDYFHCYNYKIFIIKPKGLKHFNYTPWEENKYNMANFLAVKNERVSVLERIIID